MGNMSRRSVIGASLGLAAAGASGAPIYRQRRGKDRDVWLVQGFVPQEDDAIRKKVADYKKASGNKLDYSIMPFMALNQKTISALTSGDVPDLIFHDAPSTILPQNAWDDKIVDVSDVVDAVQVAAFSDTAKLVLHLLQQGDEEAQLLPVPDQAGRDAVPHLGRPGREGRPQDVGNPEEVGRRLGLSSSRRRSRCAPRACARSTPAACRSPRSDRTTATTCSRIS